MISLIELFSITVTIPVFNTKYEIKVYKAYFCSMYLRVVLDI